MREPGVNEELLPIILVSRSLKTLRVSLFKLENNRIQWNYGMRKCRPNVQGILVNKRSLRT